MNALIIAAFGFFFFLVGIRGNAGTLFDELSKDTPGFLPWAVSIGVLAIVNEIPATQKLAAPFLFLLVLTFILRNFETLQSQFRELAQSANIPTNSGGASASY